jgi:hypothetical protein
MSASGGAIVPLQGCDTRDLYRLIQSGGVIGQQNAMVNAELVQLFAGLLDMLASGSEEQNTLAKVGDDRGGNYRFTAASRRYQKNTSLVGSDLGFETLNDVVLIGAQFERHGMVSSRGREEHPLVELGRTS